MQLGPLLVQPLHVYEVGLPVQLALIVTLLLTAGCALLVTTEHASAALKSFQFKMIAVAGLNSPEPFAADIEYVMAPAIAERTTQVLVDVVQPFQLNRVGLPSQLAVSATSVLTVGFVLVATIRQDAGFGFELPPESAGCQTTLATAGALDRVPDDAERT